MRLAVIVMVILGAFAGPAWGEAVALDAARRDLLAGRPEIRGPAPSANALRGKVVVLSFFASWCPPCTLEVKHLNELRAGYSATQVAIIGVNVFESFAGFEDDGRRLNRFVGRLQPDFPLIDGGPRVRAAFGPITRIPTLYVFDRRGDLVFRFVHREGAAKTNATLEEIEAAIEAALGADSTE